jgi:hypothetical protein
MAHYEGKKQALIRPDYPSHIPQRDRVCAWYGLGGLMSFSAIAFDFLQSSLALPRFCDF